MWSNYGSLDCFQKKLLHLDYLYVIHDAMINVAEITIASIYKVWRGKLMIDRKSCARYVTSGIKSKISDCELEYTIKETSTDNIRLPNESNKVVLYREPVTDDLFS